MFQRVLLPILMMAALMLCAADAGDAVVGITVNSSRSDARMINSGCSPNLRLSGNQKRTLLNLTGRKKSGSGWERYEFNFTPNRNGEVRLILSSGGKGRKGAARMVAYDDFRVSGGEKLRNPSFEKVSGGIYDGWRMNKENMKTGVPDTYNGKNHLRASRLFPVEQTIAVFAGQPVTISFSARADESVPPRKRHHLPLPANDYPPEYYRLYNSRVKYLPLKNKGLTPAHIRPVMETVPPAAEVPQAEFAVPDNAIRSKTDFLRVPVELLEENGVSRVASIRFGVPLAQGKFYNLSTFRVSGPDGKPVPAQFTASAFWQDRSVKSVLVQFQYPLKAAEKIICFVEAGEKLPLKPEFPPSSLKWVKDNDRFLIDTGVLSAEVDLKSFNLLKNVVVNGKMVGSFGKEGIWLTLENGSRVPLSAIPVRCVVEEAGAVRLTLRVDGSFNRGSKKYFDFTGRLSFFANSGKVDMELRFINTYLDTEFNDFASLSCRFVPVSNPVELRMNNYRRKRFFQHHDRKLQLDKKFNSDRLNGSGEFKLADGRKVTFNLFKAGLRYPKAFTLQKNAVVFELLPKQPSAKFGRDLPYYLNFPLCEGFYRLKWGMGFREHLSIDFAGELSPRAMNADAVVPVVDRDVVAASGVYPGVHPLSETTFSVWDQQFIAAFREHMKLKEKQREYGFLNYGDWFGERKRNWGNNEYDLANGLFMLFLRTGERDLFRWAQQAAIHQADTDIVHAYPDPAFIGCNAQHGIGHTGVSYQRIAPAPWSFPYGAAYLGSNGHTWSEGMIAAWMLAGDAATMDSALLLGEHLTRYTAPFFNRLGTHERSAGWSCRALLGLYRATGEQKYLDAAARMIECILAEQKPQWGGAWPHKMPGDHSGGNTLTYGNCPYLVSIVVDALRQYYLLIPDERVKKAIITASRWQLRAFQPALAGWPYGAAWDGKGYFPVAGSSRFLSSRPLAIGARLSGDIELFNAAKLALAYSLYSGVPKNGKGLASDMCMTPGIMDDLRIFAKENHQAEAFEYTPGMVEHFIRNYRHPVKELALTASRFRVKGVTAKEFLINAAGSDCMLEISRCIDRKGRDDLFWKAELLDAGNKRVALYSGKDSEQKWIRTQPLAPGRYRLLIDDKYNGEWHAGGSSGVKCYSLLLPGYTFICGLDNATGFYLHLPDGVESAEFTISALRSGIFRAAVSDGDARVIARADGRSRSRTRPGQIHKLPGEKFTVRRDKNGNGVFKLSVYGYDIALKCNVPGVMLSLEK